MQDASGITYLSKIPVPTGISINNTDYWLKVADFSQLASIIKESIAAADDGSSPTSTASRDEGDLVWLNDYLYQVIRTINAGDAYIDTGATPNVQKVTVEDLIDAVSGQGGVIKESIAIADDGDSATSSANRSVGDWVWINEHLYKVISAINAGDAYVDTGLNANIEAITIEDEIDNLINTDNTLQQAINDEIQDRIENDNVIKPEEFGAVGDGVADDTQALQDCIDYARDNKKIILLTAKYNITDKVHIYSNITILSKGGEIIYDYSYPNVGDFTQYFLMEMNDESNITIDGLAFTGPGAVADNYDICYAVGGNNCKNINIINCSFKDDAGLACIQFIDSSYIMVSNCSIKDYTYCGVGFSEACTHATVQNCTIIDGHFTGHIGNRVRYAIVLSGYGTAYDGNPRPLAHDVKAIGNYISDSEGFWEGIDCHGGEYIQIKDNQVIGCAVPCAVFSNPSQGFSVSGAEISGNFFSSNEANNSAFSQASTMGAYIGSLIEVHDNIFINTPSAGTSYRGIKIEGDSIHFDSNKLINVGSHSLLLGSDYRTTNTFIRNNLIRMGSSLTDACIFLAADTSPVAAVYVTLEGNTLDVTKLYDVVAGRTNSNTQVFMLENEYYVYPTIDVFTGLYPDIATPSTLSSTLGINNRSIKNTEPTAGGYIGWVRISGAWKGYGSIQA